MFFTVIISLVIVSLGMVAFRRFSRRPLPMPAPAGLPLFGNTFQLDQSGPHKTFTEWSQQYGPVYAMNFMGKDVVVLNSYEAIHEATVLRGNDFYGRPNSIVFDVMYGGRSADQVGLGTMDVGSRLWHVRKAFIKGVKTRGDSTSTLETNYLNILQELIDVLKAKDGQSFCPRSIIYNLITCSMYLLAFGEHVRLDDHKLTLHSSWISEMVTSMTTAGLLEFMPWLRFFGNKAYEGLASSRKAREVLFNDHMKLAKETLNKEHPVGFLESLMAYQVNNSASGSPPFTDDNIKSVLCDFFGAGVATSVSLLLSVILVMINYPEIQFKTQDEMDRVLGRGRTPTLADRYELPYLEATVMEVIRYASLLPAGVFRKTSKNTTVGGFFIPKGTQVWLNLWALHHDDFWDEPFKVKPERFLDSNGDLVPVDHPNRKRLMPFSGGRRSRPGEILAKPRIFLTVCTLLQNFTLLPADGDDQPPTSDPREYDCSHDLMPKDFQIKLAAR